MTFVGKILVILIMAFSLVFLGISTVVFSTAKNWKTVAESTKADLQKKTTLATDKENLAKEAQTKLETATADHQKVVTERENRIKELDKKVSDAEGQASASRSGLEVAQKNAQVALAEATDRKRETDTLAETLNKAQAQATQFNAQNLELTDRIRILERQKATAEQNAKDLRGTLARTTAWAQSKGLSPSEADQFAANSIAPRVSGRVTEVDSRNKMIEISIGSNDDVAAGQIYNLFRLQPQQQYLAKVKIVTTYPNKAVAEVMDQTVNRRQILEGDIVSSSFDSQ